MIHRFKCILKIFFGLMIVLTAIIAYRNSFDHLYELTFLSSFTCGLVFLTDGILNCVLSKKIPTIIFQALIVATNVVFCTCIWTLLGLHTFNFSGAFSFLHAINPPVFLLLYLFTTRLEIRSKKEYLIRIFASPVIIMGYLLFDIIRYCVTGNLVYGLISTEHLTVVSVLLIGIGFYFLMAFMAYGLQELKLFIQKKCDAHD
ncbi:MAG: hypothetical protein K2J95_11900 [Lachnospiraceae bacterium]|nr:hypothetical protein [Lachnospiraceae bacterium]